MTDERDLHDARVDAAWRAHAREMPPPALDAGILAAAHRAVQSGPSSDGRIRRARHRTWIPLAVAATLGAIAFGVVQLAPHETDTLTTPVTDAPVATARKQEPGAPAKPQAQSEESADRGVVAAQRAAESTPPTNTEQAARDARVTQPARAAPRTLRKDSAAAAPESRSAPPATPAPAADAQPMREREAFPAARAIERKSTVAAAPGAAAAPAPPSEPYADRLAANIAPPAPPSAPASSAPREVAGAGASGAVRSQRARAKVATPRTVDDFVGEIRRLRAEGRDADAALALAAFRAAYDDADARLPDDLRAWARTVARP